MSVPTSLKVVGILGIIYSSITLLATPCGLFQVIHPLSSNPMTDDLNKDPVYIGYTLGAGTLGLGMAILLLASSIGCLKAKHWARMGMNTYAVAQALLSVVGTIFMAVYALPRMQAAMATMPATPGAPPAGLMGTIMLVSLVVGLLFVMGVALTILIICNRKIAVDAFNGIFPEETILPPDYPVPPGL